MYKTRQASNEIFSPSNKTHREVGPAKDLSASLYFYTKNILDVTFTKFLCAPKWNKKLIVAF